MQAHGTHASVTPRPEAHDDELLTLFSPFSHSGQLPTFIQLSNAHRSQAYMNFELPMLQVTRQASNISLWLW